MKKELEGKFKTAAELGLKEKEYCGLLKALAWLEDGGQRETKKGKPITPYKFSMRKWGGECGSVCCIAGAADAFANTSLVGRSKGELGKLFIPGPGDLGYRHPGWDATPAQGAQALRGYLETGIADWDKVMGIKKAARRAK